MQFLQEQKTALCIPVLGFGFLRCSISCIHAVIRAVLTPQGGTKVLALT